jgi:hypothetical protein
MKTNLATLGSLAALLLTLAGTSAHAIDRFGVACIVNKTDRLLEFDMKVGDGSYSPHRLAAGYQQSYAHRYATPNEHRSPLLHISFDSDLRNGPNNRSPTRYHLEHQSAVGDSCPEGLQYWFEYDGGNRNFIKLTKRNK